MRKQNKKMEWKGIFDFMTLCITMIHSYILLVGACTLYLIQTGEFTSITETISYRHIQYLYIIFTLCFALVEGIRIGSTKPDDLTLVAKRSVRTILASNIACILLGYFNLIAAAFIYIILFSTRIFIMYLCDKRYLKEELEVTTSLQ